MRMERGIRSGRKVKGREGRKWIKRRKKRKRIPGGKGGLNEIEKKLSREKGRRERGRKRSKKRR
jgi:hypothetical protein